MATISQLDIAHLSDRDVKLAAVLLNDVASRSDGDPVGEFWRLLSHALVRAQRERTMTIRVMGEEIINDDEIGAIVPDSPDTDLPIADDEALE